MRGIFLKETIKQFGFSIGFNFWLNWSIKDPIKLFYWKYVIAKPLCTNCGYCLCKPDCEYPKITGRRNIIQYERERHEEINKQSKIIRGELDGICASCGEEEGTEIIDDPNWNTLERWLVCETCKEVLMLQRELVLFSSTKIDAPEKLIEINDKLSEISKRTGKVISNIQIDKIGTDFEITEEGEVKETNHKYDVSSTVYTGEK